MMEFFIVFLQTLVPGQLSMHCSSSFLARSLNVKKLITFLSIWTIVSVDDSAMEKLTIDRFNVRVHLETALLNPDFWNINESRAYFWNSDFWCKTTAYLNSLQSTTRSQSIHALDQSWMHVVNILLYGVTWLLMDNYRWRSTTCLVTVVFFACSEFQGSAREEIESNRKTLTGGWRN